jgi:hypothetical protein
MTTISNPPASCVEMRRPAARSCNALTLQSQLTCDLARAFPGQAANKALKSG